MPISTRGIRTVCSGLLALQTAPAIRGASSAHRGVLRSRGKGKFSRKDSRVAGSRLPWASGPPRSAWLAALLSAVGHRAEAPACRNPVKEARCRRARSTQGGGQPRWKPQEGSPPQSRVTWRGQPFAQSRGVCPTMSPGGRDEPWAGGSPPTSGGCSSTSQSPCWEQGVITAHTGPLDT